MLEKRKHLYLQVTRDKQHTEEFLQCSASMDLAFGFHWLYVAGTKLERDTLHMAERFNLMFNPCHMTINLDTASTLVVRHSVCIQYE